jgi:hypothetical protein
MIFVKSLVDIKELKTIFQNISYVNKILAVLQSLGEEKEDLRLTCNEILKELYRNKHELVEKMWETNYLVDSIIKLIKSENIHLV